MVNCNICANIKEHINSIWIFLHIPVMQMIPHHTFLNVLEDLPTFGKPTERRKMLRLYVIFYSNLRDESVILMSVEKHLNKG